HTHTHTHTTQTPHSCVLRKQKLPLHSFKHFLVICHVWHSVCVCVRERVCACSFCECGDIRDSVHVCVSLGHTIVCVLVYVPGVCVCVSLHVCVCVCVCGKDVSMHALSACLTEKYEEPERVKE